MLLLLFFLFFVFFVGFFGGLFLHTDTSRARVYCLFLGWFVGCCLQGQNYFHTMFASPYIITFNRFKDHVYNICIVIYRSSNFMLKMKS